MPLGGGSGDRRAWNPAPAEPDIDRVRLISVPLTNPGAASASPSVSRWLWVAVVAAAVVLASVLGVVVVALR